MIDDKYKDVHFSLTRSDDGSATLAVELHNPAVMRFEASPNKLVITATIRDGLDYDPKPTLTVTVPKTNEKLTKLFGIFMPVLLDKSDDHNFINLIFAHEKERPFYRAFIPDFVEEFKYSKVEVELLKRQFELLADVYRRFDKEGEQ